MHELDKQGRSEKCNSSHLQQMIIEQHSTRSLEACAPLHGLLFHIA